MNADLTRIIFRFDGHHQEKLSLRLLLALLKSSPLSVLFILIGISILVAGSFLAAFLWSVKNGQFDDDYTPSVRILFEDNATPEPSSSEKNNNPKR